MSTELENPKTRKYQNQIAKIDELMDFRIVRILEVCDFRAHVPFSPVHVFPERRMLHFEAGRLLWHLRLYRALHGLKGRPVDMSKYRKVNFGAELWFWGAKILLPGTEI